MRSTELWIFQRFFQSLKKFFQDFCSTANLFLTSLSILKNLFQSPKNSFNTPQLISILQLCTSTTPYPLRFHCSFFSSSKNMHYLFSTIYMCSGNSENSSSSRADSLLLFRVLFLSFPVFQIPLNSLANRWKMSFLSVALTSSLLFSRESFGVSSGSAHFQCNTSDVIFSTHSWRFSGALTFFFSFSLSTCWRNFGVFDAILDHSIGTVV